MRRMGWPSRATECGQTWTTNAPLMAPDLFQYADEFGKRTAFHRQCRDFGALGDVLEWQLLSFSFNVPHYLARLRAKSAMLAGVVGGFEKLVSPEFVRRVPSGLVLCGPVGVCFSEFEGTRRMKPRGLRWWQARPPNLTVAHVDAFLCDRLLSSFIHAQFNVLRLGMDMPPPLRAECTVAFTSVGEAWTRDAGVRLEGLGGAWPESASKLAVCIQGGVRSFTHREVYLSIRDNLVRSLNASFLRLFYVLNLTSDNCTWCPTVESRQFHLSELMPAIEAIGQSEVASVMLEPPCCWPRLRPGLEYRDCFLDNMAGPVQFRGREQCEAGIRQYEVAYEVSFDWVLWTRPDLRWEFPIGDIRSFELGRVHAPKLELTELSDLFALIPRTSLAVYAGAFRGGGADGSEFRCLTRDEAREVRAGVLCNLSGFSQCLHCWFGSPGCLLELHLRRHSVPLGYIPEEIASRTPRWMYLAAGG